MDYKTMTVFQTNTASAAIAIAMKVNAEAIPTTGLAPDGRTPNISQGGGTSIMHWSQTGDIPRLVTICIMVAFKSPVAEMYLINSVSLYREL